MLPCLSLNSFQSHCRNVHVFYTLSLLYPSASYPSSSSSYTSLSCHLLRFFDFFFFCFTSLLTISITLFLPPCSYCHYRSSAHVRYVPTSVSCLPVTMHSRFTHISVLCLTPTCPNPFEHRDTSVRYQFYCFISA